MYHHRKKHHRCNRALMLGIGMLLGTLLPCRVLVVVASLILCIVSLFAFKC
ncbi:MAG: hypothetical protein II501_03050 [Clostridia bacterium]|nr:hypothetical protein [Clostridia bacterium]